MLPWVGFAPPSPLVFFRGGVVACRVSLLCGVGRRLSWSWVSWFPSPLPLSFGLRLRVFFVFFRLRPSEVCFRVFGVSFPPVGCCSRFDVAGFGWMVPRCPLGGVPSLVPSGWGFGRLLWLGWAVLWLWAFLVPPPLFFLGGVCLFLPLPSLGSCKHWSAFAVVFRVAVGACVLPGLAPAPSQDSVFPLSFRNLWKFRSLMSITVYRTGGKAHFGGASVRCSVLLVQCP